MRPAKKMQGAIHLRHFLLPSARAERYIIGCRHNFHQEGEHYGDEATCSQKIQCQAVHEVVGRETQHEGQEGSKEICRQEVGTEGFEANGPRQALGTARLAGSTVALTPPGLKLILKATSKTARPPLSRGAFER